MNCERNAKGGSLKDVDSKDVSLLIAVGVSFENNERRALLYVCVCVCSNVVTESGHVCGCGKYDTV